MLVSCVFLFLSLLCVLENYPSLFDFLSPSDRRRACLDVVKAVIEDGVLVPTADHAEALLRLVTPLIADREGM